MQVSGNYGMDNQLIVVDSIYKRIHGPLLVFMATMSILGLNWLIGKTIPGITLSWGLYVEPIWYAI
jgi:hypothetical protein